MFLQSAVSGSGVRDSMSGSAKLTPFPVCIPVYSPTFAFSVEFSVIWVAPLLRASSLLFLSNLGACDRILCVQSNPGNSNPL